MDSAEANDRRQLKLLLVASRHHLSRSDIRLSIEYLEKEIKSINEKLPPLEEFLLPGGNKLSARIHHARSVCRRAERSLVALMEEIPPFCHENWLIYLNRLSDYLFVLARQSVKDDGQSERMWKRE